MSYIEDKIQIHKETDLRQLKLKAAELLSIIKSKFLTSEGLLSRQFPPQTRTIYDNFDDLVPFFLYFNQQEFLLKQLDIIIKNGETLESLCAENGVLVTRAIDEWFGGIYALWKNTKDQNAKRLLDESWKTIKNKLIHEDKFLAGAYYLEKNKKVNFFESWSSGLLETFCEMREEYPEAFSSSKKIMKLWLEHEYFQSFNLFPYRIYNNKYFSWLQKYLFSYFFAISLVAKPVFFRRQPQIKGSFKLLVKKLFFYFQNGWASQLMKSNSTPAFTLLEFYLATGDNYWKDNLLKWIKSALKNFCEPSGRVNMFFLPKIGRKMLPSVTASFILNDIICDSLYFINFSQEQKEVLLSSSKKIIDYAWENRLENGLLPYTDGGSYSQIDNQVDFSVSMRRYAEVSGDNSYKKRAVDLIKQALQEHYTSDGYVTYAGDGKSRVIDPKYNCLVLKGMINLLTMNEKMYPEYYSLFKDR